MFLTHRWRWGLWPLTFRIQAASHKGRSFGPGGFRSSRWTRNPDLYQREFHEAEKGAAVPLSSVDVCHCDDRLQSCAGVSADHGACAVATRYSCGWRSATHVYSDEEFREAQG